jgi:hypothetical protein
VKEWPFEEADGGLEAVVGVDAARDAQVVASLRAVDAGLRELAQELDLLGPARWHTHGLTVGDYPGPPRKRALEGYVEGGDLSFSVELVRGGFYDNLGRVPDRFYVAAEVAVAGEHGQKTVLALPVREVDDAAEAVTALRESLTALREEARRRAGAR